MKARRLVAASAVISAVILIAAEQNRTGQLPDMRSFIAYGFVFFMLSTFADFDIEAAGAFAVLATVAIMLEQGEDALAFVGARIGG